MHMVDILLSYLFSTNPVHTLPLIYLVREFAKTIILILKNGRRITTPTLKNSPLKLHLKLILHNAYLKKIMPLKRAAYFTFSFCNRLLAAFPSKATLRPEMLDPQTRHGWKFLSDDTCEYSGLKSNTPEHK